MQIDQWSYMSSYTPTKYVKNYIKKNDDYDDDEEDHNWPLVQTIYAHSLYLCSFMHQVWTVIRRCVFGISKTSMAEWYAFMKCKLKTIKTLFSHFGQAHQINFNISIQSNCSKLGICPNYLTKRWFRWCISILNAVNGSKGSEKLRENTKSIFWSHLEVIWTFFFSTLCMKWPFWGVGKS